MHVDMHLCRCACCHARPYAFTLAGVDTDVIPAGAGIGDEQLTESQPLVRALAVQRLEMIWRACLPMINPPVDEHGDFLYKPDARFVEAGMRCVRDLSQLYRLHAPTVSMSEPDDGSRVDQRELVRAQVAELEARTSQD